MFGPLTLDITLFSLLIDVKYPLTFILLRTRSFASTLTPFCCSQQETDRQPQQQFRTHTQRHKLINIQFVPEYTAATQVFWAASQQK